MSTRWSIPATYMRGGTSKGAFFELDKLPEAAQVSGSYRDELLLRVIGSPDPYQKQMDGLGGGTSSSSKVALISKSQREAHDVDYLFGQVAIDQPMIDWSGNCGNLTAAVGAFALHKGLVATERVPDQGICTVRVWQANIGKTLLVHVPIHDGKVQEKGDFLLDGIAFPSAEIKVEFVHPAGSPKDGSETSLFPTGELMDTLDVPDVGILEATLINAGIPTVVIRAQEVGLKGTELQAEINSNAQILAKLEAVRAMGALKMGLIQEVSEAIHHAHTPKLVMVAEPTRYHCASGKVVEAESIELLVRAMSMGQLHHALMGTAAVAIASASVIPHTLIHQMRDKTAEPLSEITLGHPSGSMRVSASAKKEQNGWVVETVGMSRSARILMEGHIPIDLSFHQT